MGKRTAKFLIVLIIGLNVNAKGQVIDTVKGFAANFPPEANTALKNGYELPITVLQYKTRLGLSAEQIVAVNKIWATLRLKQLEVTQSTQRNEHMLDSLFRTNRINEGTIIFYTNRYGLYEGEYRGAVLMACYNTRRVLTPAQLNKLKQLQNHN